MTLTPLQVLRDRFGFESFRPGQLEIIESVLDGNDTLAVRPTGSGKSLCFQIPGLILPGTTLVISPLISLMKDQVQALQANGISAVAVHSGLEVDELRRVYGQISTGNLKFVYVSPERTMNGPFPLVLKRLFSKSQLSLIAVDEAHCISRWGRDFRPSYRRVRDLRHLCPGIPVVALTATALPRIQEDILELLEFNRDNKIFISDFDRPNLSYGVCPVPSAKDKRLMELVSWDSEAPGIIFCATRKAVEAVHLMLKKNGINSLPYHGGMHYGQRKFVQESFLNGEVPWIAATSAFGMGIDKRDLRTVVHYHMPGSLEQYIQECGRAGRDGNLARCLLLYSISDRRIHEGLIVHSKPRMDIVEPLFQEILSHGKCWETSESEILRSLQIRADSDLNLEPGEKSLHRYLNLLEEHGFIHWVRDRGIWTITRQSSSLELHGIRKINMGIIEESFLRLEQMERYCTHQGCLREFLKEELSSVGTVCENCSGCRGDYGIEIDESDPVIHRILDFAREYPEHCRVSTIAAVLGGSRSQALKAQQLHDSPYYGILSEHSQVKIRDLVRQLFYVGHIRRPSYDSGSIAQTA